MASELCNDSTNVYPIVSETYNIFLMDKYQKLFNPEHDENDNLFETTLQKTRQNGRKMTSFRGATAARPSWELV